MFGHHRYIASVTHHLPLGARSSDRRWAFHPRIASVAALSAAALVGCVDQPKPYCIATTSAFALKLTQTGLTESTPGACEGFVNTFIVEPKIGLWPYYQRGSDGQPDYGRGSIAIQTADLGTRVYAAQDRGVENSAPDAQLYSLGDFSTAKPDDQNFCSVPTLSPTRVVLAALPAVADDPATEDDESLPEQAAVDSTIAWSNVRVYVTPDTFGTQMDGEFSDTRLTPTGDSCTISYRALGLAPAVRCAATDDEGTELTNPDGTYQVDENICNPEANLAEGRPTGSGISPSARYECDPVTAYCVVQGDSVPALR